MYLASTTCLSPEYIILFSISLDLYDVDSDYPTFHKGTEV